MRIKEMINNLMIKQILTTGTIRNTCNLENSEENMHADVWAKRVKGTLSWGF